MPSLSPELWTQVLTSVVTLIIGLSSGTAIVAWLQRRKTAAEAGKAEAETDSIVVAAAHEAMGMLRQALEDAEKRCADKVEAAVMESERRCEERAERRKQERDEELRQLRDWANGQIAESCRKSSDQQAQIDRLQRELTEERGLREERETEMEAMVRGMP